MDSYPVTTLSAVDVSQGIHSSGLKGALVGGLTGFAAGLVLAYYETRGCKEGPCGIAWAVVPEIGAFAGVFIGGAAGSRNRREDWQPVAIPAWK